MLRFTRAIAVSAALLAPALLASPAAAVGFYSGTVTGYFTNLQTTGSYIDTDGSFVFDGDGSDAAYAGGGTSSLTWGSPQGQPAPGVSTLAFTGDSFVNKRSFGGEGVEGQVFHIGTLTYFNGTSVTGSLLYGATLHLDVENASELGVGPVEIESFDLNMSFLATVNTGLGAARDSDFLGFDGFDETFNIYENGTATIDFYGLIFGDPQFFPDHFDLNGGDGFIGGGIGDPDPPGTGGVPEPAGWAMMILGFGGVGATLRRRRSGPAVA